MMSCTSPKYLTPASAVAAVPIALPSVAPARSGSGSRACEGASARTPASARAISSARVGGRGAGREGALPGGGAELATTGAGGATLDAPVVGNGSSLRGRSR